MDDVKKRKGKVASVQAQNEESAAATWDDLLRKVTPSGESDTVPESLRQIVEDVEISDPSQLNEFRKKTEQLGPGQ